MILGAAYMLSLVQRLFYGPESDLAASKPAPKHDLHFRELAALVPLAVLMLVLGLAPSIWTPSIEKSVHLPRTGGMTPEQQMLSIPIAAEGQR